MHWTTIPTTEGHTYEGGGIITHFNLQAVHIKVLELISTQDLLTHCTSLHKLDTEGRTWDSKISYANI